jgi:hypothetical protein
MDGEHRIVQISSHVTSFVGRVGVIGLCSCGWFGGAEGEDTVRAVSKLREDWETHAPDERLAWVNPPTFRTPVRRSE